MPTRPLRPCRHPGCPRLTSGGYCMEHAQGSARAGRPRRSTTVRREVDERDGRRCVVCGSAVGIEKHHIVPLSKGGADEPSNMVTLCAVHHRIAHLQLNAELQLGRL